MGRQEKEILIQETDLDVFGHVNNAVYLRLFENARWDYIENHGWGLKKIQSSGIGPVILEIQIKFTKELKARDRIKIISEFLPFEGKIAKVRQTMVDDQGRSCCQAEFVFAVFDVQKRKIISPPDEWLKMAASL